LSGVKKTSNFHKHINWKSSTQYESYMVFLELYSYISELPFIVVWIFLSFPSPLFLKGQRKILQHILMLKTNFVCDNILQVIYNIIV